MIFTVPVTPNSGDARDWIARELSQPEYRAAEPNWFDRLVSQLITFLRDLLGSATGAPPAIGWSVVLVALAVALVAAYLAFGPPRLARRGKPSGGTLFGDDDARSSEAIRRAAEFAASTGDYTLAIVEMFRASARGLAERAVVTTTPGTTATGFAVQAGAYFPALAIALASSATVFDTVRYLGRVGSDDDYATVAALERGLRAATPRFEQVTA